MLKRHNLLFIKNRDIPGIVKRQDEKKVGFIQVGYSYPDKVDGIRKRSVELIKIDDIRKILTPIDILKIYESGNQKIEILDEIIKIARNKEIEIGIFGSLSLEIVTKKKYYTFESDIDLIIFDKNIKKIKDFYKEIVEIEKKYLKNIDLELELELEGNYSCKLKEFLNKQETILVKGIWDIRLMYKNEVPLEK